MSKTKRSPKPRPTTIRLRPADEARLLEIAKAHNCVNATGRYKGRASWRVLIQELIDGTLYVGKADTTHAA